MSDACILNIAKECKDGSEILIDVTRVMLQMVASLTDSSSGQLYSAGKYERGS
jgi:hypothetical protein